jgi:hypothetical protein
LEPERNLYQRGIQSTYVAVDPAGWLRILIGQMLRPELIVWILDAASQQRDYLWRNLALTAREERSVVATAAVARELLGFICSIGQRVPLGA